MQTGTLAEWWGRVSAAALGLAVRLGLPLLMVLLPLPMVSGVRAAEGGGVAVPLSAKAREIVPAPLPDAENAAPLYMEAVAALEAEDVWGRNVAELAAEIHAGLYAPAAPRNLIALLDEFQVAEEGNRHPTLSEACDEFARRLDGPGVTRAMSLMAQATALSRSRFNLDYTRGPEILMPHLAKLRSLSRFLGTVAVSTAEQGDEATAWESALWGLHLADCVREEPLLISQLVRAAQAAIALTVVQQVAVCVPPDAETSRRLEVLLDRLDDREPWARALRGEWLLFGEWAFAQPPGKLRELLQVEAGKEIPPVPPEELAAEHEACGQTMARLAELALRPYLEARAEVEALTVPPADGTEAATVRRALLPALGPCFRKIAEAEALVRVTRVGLRLRQHRQAHGTYPATLAEVDLTGLPPEKQQDPFSGAPLRYRPDSAGFILYSLGPDTADNGGTPRPAEGRGAFDIVWHPPK